MDLRKVPRTAKRRCWVRLGVRIGVDLTVTVSWKRNGQKLKDDGQDSFSAMLLLNNPDVPNQEFVNEFRAPIEQRHGSDSTISHDTLPGHLERLKAVSVIQDLSREIISTAAPSYSSKCLTCQL